MQIGVRIMETGRKLWFLVKETYWEFMEDNGIKLGASLSYYAIFSLPALLIVIISVCGFFFGVEAVRGEIFGKINKLVGNESALAIQDIIKNVALSNSNTFVATVGIAILVVSASGVFADLQDSLNFIWRIKAKPKRGLMKFIMNRLMSFLMIISLGILLLVALLLDAVMEVLHERLTENFLDQTIFLLTGVNALFVFLSITVLFTIIFRILPDGKIKLRDCVVGALFTAVLFILGKFAISAYLGSSAIASVYGAAGSVILILIWVYYSAIILYFGAEFTKVFANAHGGKIIPNAYAVYIINKEIEIEVREQTPKDKSAKDLE